MYVNNQTPRQEVLLHSKVAAASTICQNLLCSSVILRLSGNSRFDLINKCHFFSHQNHKRSLKSWEMSEISESSVIGVNRVVKFIGVNNVVRIVRLVEVVKEVADIKVVSHVLQILAKTWISFSLHNCFDQTSWIAWDSTWCLCSQFQANEHHAWQFR